MNSSPQHKTRMSFEIRAERPAGAELIREVTDAAFRVATHSSGTEGAIVDSVGPGLHGQGVGSALIRDGLARLQEAAAQSGAVPIYDAFAAT